MWQMTVDLGYPVLSTSLYREKLSALAKDSRSRRPRRVTTSPCLGMEANVWPERMAGGVTGGTFIRLFVCSFIRLFVASSARCIVAVLSVKPFVGWIAGMLFVTGVGAIGSWLVGELVSWEVGSVFGVSGMGDEIWDFPSEI